MSFPEHLMLAVVIALGLFAGWRNATAGALAVVYFLVMIPHWKWGFEWPTPVSLLFDASVLVAMYCKDPAFDCYPYDSWGDQFCSLWFERSYADRLVIALFPIGWLTYIVSFGHLTWWILWIVALGQYLAAGGETLQASLSARSAKADNPKPDDQLPGMNYVAVRVRGYG